MNFVLVGYSVMLFSAVMLASTIWDMSNGHFTLDCGAIILLVLGLSVARGRRSTVKWALGLSGLYFLATAIVLTAILSGWTDNVHVGARLYEPGDLTLSLAVLIPAVVWSGLNVVLLSQLLRKARVSTDSQNAMGLSRQKYVRIIAVAGILLAVITAIFLVVRYGEDAKRQRSAAKAELANQPQVDVTILLDQAFVAGNPKGLPNIRMGGALFNSVTQSNGRVEAGPVGAVENTTIGDEPGLRCTAYPEKHPDAPFCTVSVVRKSSSGRPVFDISITNTIPTSLAIESSRKCVLLNVDSGKEVPSQMVLKAGASHIQVTVEATS